MHLPLTVPAGALRSSGFCTVVHPRGLHALPLTLAEVPGGFRLVKVKPQHRNIVKGRTQQLSKCRGKGISDFCFCCLVPAIWKTTFLLGNYKSQSALWEEHALYQLVPSTNSQIWIRNQFWKRLTLAGYSPQRLRKGARQHNNKVSLQYTKISFKNLLWGAAKNIPSLRRAAQHCTGDVGVGCCGDGGDFWNKAVVSGGEVSSRSSCGAEWVRSCFPADAPY